MRLIDADAVTQKANKDLKDYSVIQRGYGKTELMLFKTVQAVGAIDYMQNASTVDPIKHGYWIRVPKQQNLYGYYREIKCSACGYQLEEYFSKNYCCKCGARMDLKNEDQATLSN